jgi:type 1 fimbria pilin
MMTKKRVAVLLAIAAVGSAISVANAADQGHGTVNFVGSIIDAPCSISPDTIDQTVNLGQISNRALLKGGKSTPRVFNIKLEDCDVANLTDKTVTTTFTGTESKANPGYLAIAGTASGAAIAITSDDGNNIKLGSASPTVKVQDGKNTLRFAAYLQGNPDVKNPGGATVPAVIVPGEFTSVANFTLAYQ